MNSIQPYSPDNIEEAIARLDISKDKNGFFGFKLDDSFLSHQESFKALAAKGFSSPPPWKQRQLHRFMLERSDAEESGDEVAITFEYEEKNLRRIGFIISCNPKNSKNPKADSIRMVKCLVDSMGQPHIFLNRFENLKDFYLDTQDPSTICSIFWSGVENLTNQTVEIFDSDKFSDVLSKLGHSGCLANLYELSGSLIVSVDFFKNKGDENRGNRSIPII